MLSIGLNHFLVLAAILFGCGIATVLTKRNAIGILMGVELILNAANVNLVAFNRYVWSAHPQADGHAHVDGMMFTMFIIVLAAAEAAIALAIFLNFYNNYATIDIERARLLKG